MKLLKFARLTSRLNRIAATLERALPDILALLFIFGVNRICSLLQSVAVCCSLSQSVVVCCSLCAGRCSHFGVCPCLYSCPSLHSRGKQDMQREDMQCVVMCCSVLQCIAATFERALHGILALPFICVVNRICGVLQCVAVCVVVRCKCCNVLNCVAACCSVFRPL